MSIFHRWGHTWVRLRVYLLNIGAGSDADKLADLEAMRDEGAALILGQEFSDRTPLVEKFLERNPEWAVAWGTHLIERHCPVFYDKRRLVLTRWSLLKTWLGGFLGPQGKGQDSPGGTYLNRPVFKSLEAKGQKVKVLNHHLVVSAFSTHGPERARRMKAWTAGAVGFFRVVRATRIPVLGGGDWNGEAHQLVEFTPNGWTWDSIGPTIRKMTIDLLGHARHSKLRALDAGVEESSGSRKIDDHRKVWVDYALRVRRS